MEEQKLIPTSFKSKIPKFLSYPVGAEIITHELYTVPQFDKLSISFSYYNSLKNQTDRAKPYSIIEARFRNIKPSLSSSTRFIEEGWYNEHWEIYVNPVPREVKYKVKELMRNDGFAKIRNWFYNEKNFIGYEGRKSLTIP